MNTKTFLCEAYCPTNQINIGDVCLPCTKESCKELNEPLLNIERISNETFLLTLTETLKDVTYNNLDQHFEFYFDDEKLIQ